MEIRSIVYLFTELIYVSHITASSIYFPSFHPTPTGIFNKVSSESKVSDLYYSVHSKHEIINLSLHNTLTVYFIFPGIEHPDEIEILSNIHFSPVPALETSIFCHNGCASLAENIRKTFNDLLRSRSYGFGIDRIISACKYADHCII